METEQLLERAFFVFLHGIASHDIGILKEAGHYEPY